MKTTIKERLEKLDYSDVYDLWNLWILQNVEPPDRWLLIHELSDLAAMDEHAAAELSDEIDKLLADEDETTSDNKIQCADCGCEISSGLLCSACGSKQLVCEPDTPIEILVRGGCVYAVDNVPDGKNRRSA